MANRWGVSEEDRKAHKKVREKRWRDNNREKFREMARRQYKKSRVSRLSYSAEYAKENRALWIQILTAMDMVFCKSCGYDESFSAIDFHHPDPEKKVLQPALLLCRRPTKERILEIAECIPLCANCHRKLHELQRAEDKRDGDNTLN